MREAEISICGWRDSVSAHYKRACLGGSFPCMNLIIPAGFYQHISNQNLLSLAILFFIYQFYKYYDGCAFISRGGGQEQQLLEAMGHMQISSQGTVDKPATLTTCLASMDCIVGRLQSSGSQESRLVSHLPQPARVASSLSLSLWAIISSKDT